MLRDVATRWNSTFDMLNFAVEYRKALDMISGDQEMELHKYELTENEWKITSQLQDVLKVHIFPHSHTQLLGAQRSTLTFQIPKDVTLFFSCSTPNLATVIPAMDIIDEKLTTDSLDRSRFEAPICTALGLTKKTLNRYYNLTDSSELYRIAMGMYHFILSLSMYADVCDYAVLHPRHKFAYFKNAGWEDEWIKTAERIVRKEYERLYAHQGDAEDGDAMGDEGAANIVHHYHDINIKLSYSACTLQQKTSLNIFNNIPELAKPILSGLWDELTAYLSSDPEYVNDVLSWWYEK